MKKAKQLNCKARLLRSWWEMDLSDVGELDLTAGLPTPTTHPDLFYRVTAPAYPELLLTRVRRPRPYRLTRTQLRKRLSRTGLQGQALRRTVLAVQAGPRLATRQKVCTVLGWPDNALRALLGARAYRAATQGLARSVSR